MIGENKPVIAAPNIDIGAKSSAIGEKKVNADLICPSSGEKKVDIDLSCPDTGEKKVGVDLICPDTGEKKVSVDLIYPDIGEKCAREGIFLVLNYGFLFGPGPYPLFFRNSLQPGRRKPSGFLFWEDKNGR